MTALLLLILIGIIDLVVLAKLMYAFGLLKMREHKLPQDDTLPSVTICIPARDEIHAMTASLDRVVASDYPKLEIIVLDDESRDKTSVLIKSYAASGVRFIEGKPLPDGWLGKNYAQSVLAREASGSIVFFMDVDTIIRPQTVSKTVAYMLGEHADMVSIIPQRMDTWRASVIFATLRHFWTVIRYRARRPRAASNAWIVKRDVLLKQLDTDTTLPMSVQVETTIARTLAPEHKYRLVLSDANLGLSYEKKVAIASRNKYSSAVSPVQQTAIPSSGACWATATFGRTVCGNVLDNAICGHGGISVCHLPILFIQSMGALQCFWCICPAGRINPRSDFAMH